MEIKELYKKFLKAKGVNSKLRNLVAGKKIDVSKKGLWDKNRKQVIVPSNRITMKGPNGEQDFFKKPVIATGLQSGQRVMMQPGGEYYFPNDKAVHEVRMQGGGSVVINNPTQQPELNKQAMTGLMKSKIAYADAFNNPTGARMTNRDPRSYTFTKRDEESGGAPEGSQGNVYMGSYGEFTAPQIQDVNGKLKFIAEPFSPENAARSEAQSIKFNSPDEAQYFGEHYKEVAPMMNVRGGNPKEGMQDGAIKDNTTSTTTTDDWRFKPNKSGWMPDWQVISNRQWNSYGSGPSNVESQSLKGPLTYSRANPVSLKEFKNIFESLPGYNTGYESIRDADPKKLGIQEGPLTESRDKEVDKVLPEDIITAKYRNKTLGTLPLFEASGIYEGYSPSRIWTGSPYLGMSRSSIKRDDFGNYVPFTKEEKEEFLQDTGRYLYFISPKESNKEKFKGQLSDYKNKMPISDLLFGQSKVMAKQLQSTPEITNYLKSKGVDSTALSTTVPDSRIQQIYANQLAESIVASRDAKKFNRPYGISASNRESLVIQDPKQFNLSGYLPASSEMFDEEKWKTDKEYKNAILKKAGVPESEWNTIVVHTSPFPIDQYKPSMKKGGIIQPSFKMQDGAITESTNSQRYSAQDGGTIQTDITTPIRQKASATQDAFNTMLSQYETNKATPETDASSPEDMGFQLGGDVPVVIDALFSNFAKKHGKKYAQDGAQISGKTPVDVSTVELQGGGLKYIPTPQERAYSDNTRVVTPEGNMTDADRERIAQIELAKRRGSISQGKKETTYEKAKRESSFVEREKQRTGNASPISYVMDAVNPAAVAFAATDLVRNTGSAIKNTAKGNFSEAGNDLLQAGVNALGVLPAASQLKNIAKPLSKLARISPSQSKSMPTINNFSKFDELTPQSMDDIYHRVVNSPGYSDDVQEAIDYWQEYKHASPSLDKAYTLELGEDLPLTRRLKTPLTFDESGYVINSGKPTAFSAGLGNDLLGQHRVHLMAPKGTKVSPISRAASSTSMQGEREILFPTTSKFKKLDTRLNPKTGLEDYIIGLEMKKGGIASESVTCSNCGWSWKISEGGLNPLSCHKCGGVAKMQMGGMSIPGVNGSVVSNTNAPTLRNKEGYKQGGNIDHSDDKDMVNGVASILRRVKDKDNRLQLANQLSSQFNREKVNYNLNDFLNKSKVKK